MVLYGCLERAECPSVREKERMIKKFILTWNFTPQISFDHTHDIGVDDQGFLGATVPSQ